MLIDFGFAKAKKKSESSAGLNGGLVARVRDCLKDGCKGKKIFSDWVRKTEKSEGVVMDVRAKVQRDMKRKKLARLAKIVGWDKAVEMMGGDDDLSTSSSRRDEDSAETSSAGKKKKKAVVSKETKTKKKKKTPVSKKKTKKKSPVSKKRKTPPAMKGSAAVIVKKRRGRGSAQVLNNQKKKNEDGIIEIEEEENTKEHSGRTGRGKTIQRIATAATGAILVAGVLKQYFSP